MSVVGVEAVSSAWAFSIPGVDGVGEPCFADDFSCGVDDLDVRWCGEHLFAPVVLDGVDGQADAGGKCADRESSGSHARQNTPARVANTPVRVYSFGMRKKTVFNLCESHVGLGGGYRTAEIVCEGGPASGSPCAPRPCQILPGEDFYAEGCTDEEFSGMVANWAINRQKRST